MQTCAKMEHKGVCCDSIDFILYFSRREYGEHHHTVEVSSLWHAWLVFLSHIVDLVSWFCRLIESPGLSLPADSPIYLILLGNSSGATFLFDVSDSDCGVAPFLSELVCCFIYPKHLWGEKRAIFI